MSLNPSASCLALDINTITSRGNAPYNDNFRVQAKLHTAEANLDHTDRVYVATLAIERDYVTQVGDHIVATFSIPLGTLIYDVMPYMANLEVSLIITRQAYQDNAPYITSERYKAIFLPDENMALTTDSLMSKDMLNQNPSATLTLKLLDRSVECLRVKTLSGSFDARHNTANDLRSDNLLRAAIGGAAKTIKIDGRPILEGVDVIASHNTEPYKTLVVPSYTRVVELGDWMQLKGNGFYNSGFGSYVQRHYLEPFSSKKQYFVYDLFEPKRYTSDTNKAVFYVPDNASYSTSGKTYTVEDGLVRVVVDPTDKLPDNYELGEMNAGVGFRATNARSILTKPVEMTKDGPVFVRHRLVTEMAMKERDDGMNFALHHHATGNQFKLRSDVMQRAGTHVVLSANHFDADFIRPGMSCMIVIERNGRRRELKGIVHYVRQQLTAIRPDPLSAATRADAEFVSKTVFGIFTAK